MTVIVDAAFLEVVNRDLFRTWAGLHGFPFVIVSCQADGPEKEARIKQRQLSGGDPSDADVLELHRQIQNWVLMSAAERPYILEINTMSENAVPIALQGIRSIMNASASGLSKKRLLSRSHREEEWR
jgi:predicted kinase